MGRPSLGWPTPLHSSRIVSEPSLAGLAADWHFKASQQFTRLFNAHRYARRPSFLIVIEIIKPLWRWCRLAGWLSESVRRWLLRWCWLLWCWLSLLCWLLIALLWLLVILLTLAFLLAADELHFISYDFCRIAVLPALVLPFTGL